MPIIPESAQGGTILEAVQIVSEKHSDMAVEQSTHQFDKKFEATFSIDVCDSWLNKGH